MYFIRNKEEIHLPFKNSEKWQAQALSLKKQWMSRPTLHKKVYGTSKELLSSV